MSAIFDPLAVKLCFSSDHEVALFLEAHGFLLLSVQKPCRFNLIWEEEQANPTDEDGDNEFDDKEPSPGGESISISHGLNGICEQSTKRTGDTLGEIRRHDTLSRQFSGIDGREQKGKTLGKAGLGGVQNHTNSDSLPVSLDERSPEGTSAPQGECRANGFLSTEASNGQDPRELKEDGADAR